MSFCARIDQTEDLVLGLLSGAGRVEAEEHLAVCSDCWKAYESLEEERELFARRAEATEAPPYLDPSVFEAKPEPRKRIFERSLPAVFAVAASIAFPVVGHLHRPSEPPPEQPATVVSSEILASNEHPFSYEPSGGISACSAPHAPESTDRRFSALGAAACEEPLASVELETSMP